MQFEIPIPPRTTATHQDQKNSSLPVQYGVIEQPFLVNNRAHDFAMGTTNLKKRNKEKGKKKRERMRERKEKRKKESRFLFFQI